MEINETMVKLSFLEWFKMRFFGKRIIEYDIANDRSVTVEALYNNGKIYVTCIKEELKKERE